MEAIWNGKVIAEADSKDIILIEGNSYFPPGAIRSEYFKEHKYYHTTCHWKGEASYFDVNVDGQNNENAAWFYPELIDGSSDLVGKDFTNYVAFWHGVEVKR